MENEGKVLSDRQLSHLLRFMTHSLKIPAASSRTAHRAARDQGLVPGIACGTRVCHRAVGAAGTSATPTSPLPAQGLALKPPQGHPSSPFGDDGTNPGTL